MFKRGQKGFTLIEAVVAAGVFAFVVASSLGVYMATIQLDSKSRSERSVQQNARFIMELFSKEIRNGSIDYAGQNDADTLSLRNQLDEDVRFDWVGHDLTLTKAGLGTTNLNSSDVQVTNFRFILNPTVDPFQLGNDVHVQPHVIVVMTLTSTNQKVAETATMNLESTFAVREYPGR